MILKRSGSLSSNCSHALQCTTTNSSSKNDLTSGKHWLYAKKNLKEQNFVLSLNFTKSINESYHREEKT